MAEVTGEMRVEVEACIGSFEPERFDLKTTAAEIDEIKETFHAVRKGPPPVPPR